MSNPIDRREFLERIASAALAAQLASPAIFTGAANPADLLQYVDPLVRPPVVAPLPDVENALPLLKEAAVAVTDRRCAFVIGDCHGTNWLDAHRADWIDPWLDENRRSMALVKQAVARGKLAFPPTQGGSDRVGEDVFPVRSLDRLLQLSAQRAASEGKLAEAAEISKTMFEMFRLLEGGADFLWEYLTANEGETNAWNLMRHIASRPDANAKLVRGLLASLPTRDDPAGPMRRAVRATCCHRLLPALTIPHRADLAGMVEAFGSWSERCAAFVSREEFESRSKRVVRLLDGHPKPFDLIDTVKRASARSAASIRGLDLAWPVHKALSGLGPAREASDWPEQLTLSGLTFPGEAFEITEAEIQAAHEKLLSIENPIGRHLLDSVLEDSMSLHESALINQAYYDGTRLLLAVRFFELDTGDLPPNLHALVAAKILAAVPPDPFSVEEFQYSRDGRAIWSVGPEGTVSPSSSAPECEFYICRLGTSRR